MTYSYAHKAINNEAFPSAIDLYNPYIMTGRGKDKYCYKPSERYKAESKLRDLLSKYFPYNKIIYFS